MSILSLNTVFDLLDKCIYEIDHLKIYNSHPEYDYYLLNLIFSLNHIFDWFLNDKRIPDNLKLECISKFNPHSLGSCIPRDYKQYYDKFPSPPEPNKYQEAIRLLCNKAKHFAPRKSIMESQEKNYTALLGEIQCGEPEAQCGAYNQYLYFVEINGEVYDLAKLVIELGQEWSTFIKGLNLPHR